MKNIVITLALLVLCSFILLYQLDADLMERETYRVKAACDRISSAASLCIDGDAYALGQIVFSYDRGNDLAFEMLRDNLGYDESYYPEANDYFSGQASMRLYYFDDSLQARCYENGSFAGSFEFLYGREAGQYVPEYSDTGILIEKPCVVCVLDCGRPNIRAGVSPDGLKIVRKSIYEYR